jgi:hypothetical protein
LPAEQIDDGDFVRDAGERVIEEKAEISAAVVHG